MKPRRVLQAPYSSLPHSTLLHLLHFTISRDMAVEPFLGTRAQRFFIGASQYILLSASVPYF